MFLTSTHFLPAFSLQTRRRNESIRWPLGYFSTEMFMGWLLGIHVCSMSPGSWLKARDAVLKAKERMLQCHLHLGQKHTWMRGQQRKQTVPLYILSMHCVTLMVTSRNLQQVASKKHVTLVWKSVFICGQLHFFFLLQPSKKNVVRKWAKTFMKVIMVATTLISVVWCREALADGDHKTAGAGLR